MFYNKKNQSIESLFNSIFSIFFLPLQKSTMNSLSSNVMTLCVHAHVAMWIGTEGANGEGVAIVSSLSSFDREQQKEYLLPIVIKDSGN